LGIDFYGFILLREFLNDVNKQIYKIQADNFPESLIDYVQTQAESFGLSTRLIKGVYIEEVSNFTTFA
jgi:hypothetical protein